MALSVYSNWGSSMDHCTSMSEMGFQVPHTPNQHQKQEYYDDSSTGFDVPINFDDPLLDAINDFLSVDAFDDRNEVGAPALPIDDGEDGEQFLQFQSFSDPSLLSQPQDLSPMPDPFEDIVSFHTQQTQPKRARSFNDLDFCSNTYGTTNAVVNPCLSCSSISRQLLDYTSSHPQFVFPQMPAMEYCIGRGSYNSTTTGKPSTNGCLSVQSAAARERRKRISDKTQELGRLIPGGHKMNTAEMFQSAAKYVKFLQAQIGILALLPQYHQNHHEESSEEERKLQEHLLTSTAVQEKLYKAERCIFPKRMVDYLRNDTAVKSYPSISRDFRKFFESLYNNQSSTLTSKIS